MDAAEDDDGARPPTKRFGLAAELVVEIAARLAEGPR